MAKQLTSLRWRYYLSAGLMAGLTQSCDLRLWARFLSARVHTK